MSASTSPTLWPSFAIAIARFTASVVFPTPPLPEPIAMIAFTPGNACGCGICCPCAPISNHSPGVSRGPLIVKIPQLSPSLKISVSRRHLLLGVLIRPNRPCQRGLSGLRLALALQFLLPQLSAPRSIFVVLLLFLGLRLQPRHWHSPTLAVHRDKRQIGRSHMPVHSRDRVLHPNLHSDFHRGVE